MRRAVLVFGNPGNGKSTLADALSKHHGFHPLSVDAIYVAFVANSYPNLSLPDLRLYIAQHYDTILRLDAARESAWCSHLTELILAALQEHDAVVADGYLLYQCKDGIQTVFAEN